MNISQNGYHVIICLLFLYAKTHSVFALLDYYLIPTLGYLVPQVKFYILTHTLTLNAMNRRLKIKGFS